MSILFCDSFNIVYLLYLWLSFVAVTGQTDVATLSAEVTPSNGVQSTVGEVSSIVESVSTSSRSLSVGSVSAEMTRFEEVQSSSANSQSPSMTPNPTVTGKW